MVIIGVVGGVASGKSLVANLFKEHGAAVLDGDLAGHEVLQQPEVRQAIRSRWGDKVFNNRGEVDRAAAARVVFSSPEELKYLENLTHPRIGALLRQQLDAMAAAGTAAVVLDAAVMIKAGWHQMCDVLLFVDTPRSVRLARAMKRGWTEEQFDQREKAQTPLEKKQALADVIIDNSGDEESTRQQVQQFWQSHVAESSR